MKLNHKIGAVFAFCLGAGVIPAVSFATSPIAEPEVGTPAQTGAPKPVVVNPQWVRKPKRDDITRAYPKQALKDRVSGKAVLRCRVTLSGSVKNCILISETPPMYGFGDAALRLSEKFKMTPGVRDGVPFDGAWVMAPITFNCQRCELSKTP